MADVYTRAIFNAVRGAGQKRYTFYPIVAGAIPAGVALPHDANTGAGLWGVETQITLAVASPVVEFWLCGAVITADATVIIEPHAVRIGSGLAGAMVPLAEFFFAASSAVAANMLANTQHVPYPVYCPAATPLSGQAATVTKAVAANITVAVLLATGL